MENGTKKVQESYNTSDLASDLAKKFGLPKAQALRIVSATFTLLGNAVARDAIVRLHQFGNFKRLETKERQGRNPKTGDTTVIEASARPHFVASQALKAKVKSGEQEVIDVTAPVQESEDADATAAPAAKAKPSRPAPQPRRQVARPQKPAPAPAPQVSEEPAVDGSAIDEL